MSFESPHPDEAKDINVARSAQYVESPEFMGGPLRPNHLLTSKLGAEEASLVLDRLNVRRKVSESVAEITLNANAVAPAEYRIEIMNPNDPDKAASEEYVQSVFIALRKAQVPVRRVASDNSKQT